MKLILISIGMVIGIYLAFNYPDVAAQIFDTAIVWAESFGRWLQSMLGSRL